MQIKDRIGLSGLEKAISKSQNYLLSLQNCDGYWWAPLESNVTITAEIVLLYKIWGLNNLPWHKIEAYLRFQQRSHGGWELFYGDGGEVSTSVEAYMALRILGVPVHDPIMIKAKKYILSKGGISKTRIFTKIHLALIGCYSWKGIPSLPPWVMLLPEQFPFTIYEMSSWARSSTVPLIPVFNSKSVYQIKPGNSVDYSDSAISLNELYVEGGNRVDELPRKGDWTDAFVLLDEAFKFAENLNLVPLREEGIKAAERWVIERQEQTGDWGGIIPAMFNSMLALRVLNYSVHDPIVVRGFKALENFAVETADTYWIQPCVSPVWDTALVMRSLVDSGLPPNHPALVKGGEWLLDKQILNYGDWAVKNSKGKPGAWAFEFDNRFYPDVDDTAVVVMALDGVELPNENLKIEAIRRAVAWIASMQCVDGGWAAFDVDNNQDWINDLPYADLKAMIDPNTADVTARVLEMFGKLSNSQGNTQSNNRKGILLPIENKNIDRAFAYLKKEQELEGCWFGRWGVNYIYGTSGVLTALSLLAPSMHRSHIEKGAAWLISCQNPDGGWGETCFSYEDPMLKGRGKTTPSQTAWALIGLMAAGDATRNYAKESLERGIDYLLRTQRDDGSWDESEFTGTGFPCHFYLNYNLYRQHFPLTALGRYRILKNDSL
jgi:squalene-hopene/tetraprenyl-beta-curcumene cyclase